MAERCVPELAYLARNEYTNDVQYRSQHRKRQVSNVQLVEQHCISKRDPRYAIIDAAAFRSKNLYNAASYEMRQTFFNEGMYLAYEEDSSKFTGRPHIPKYKHKTEGRNILIYTMQAVSRGKRSLQRGSIRPSMLPIEVKTQQDPKQIDQVRIIPRNCHYVIEVIYRKAPVQAQVDPSFCVAIDLGVTNLAAITSNREGFIPRLVNGRTLKARNQWYNKRMKELKLCLPKEERERVTKQMEQITNKRNRQVNHYLHAASKRMIDFLVKQGVGTIIVGKNPLWKQEAGMGKRNNQNFVQIPHARFIEMLIYKAALVGIQIEVQEESYTSKASFLDLDPIPTYQPNDDTEHTFSGKRIGRRNRLYRTKDGQIICADVNGSYNILRKSKPDAFAHVDKGLAAYVVQPLRLAITV